LALRDSLTNLYNHGYFQEILKQEVEEAKDCEDNLALLLLDIDNFKRINDTYGHQAGDKILAKLADLLQNNTRDNDTVARYGGEEFAIALNNVTLKAAVKIGEELKGLIANMEVVYDEEIITITVSIGVAYSTSSQNSYELINSADEQLYLAKESGKNCVSY
ncbi:MAG: GGDEF domain-containing protein, partial [Bacillota bacterium]